HRDHGRVPREDAAVLLRPDAASHVPRAAGHHVPVDGKAGRTLTRPVSEADVLATRAAMEAAARRIAGTARVTPALDLAPLAPLAVKCEQMQPIGAFKVRGAVNFMAQLPEARLRAGVITYSSGNHGQAVAFAAQRMGTRAVVVMPETAPAVKVEGARAWGAEVLFAGTTTVHRQARAEEEAARRGLTMVPPFDCLRIIEGQGTV